LSETKTLDNNNRFMRRENKEQQPSLPTVAENPVPLLYLSVEESKQTQQ